MIITIFFINNWSGGALWGWLEVSDTRAGSVVLYSHGEGSLIEQSKVSMNLSSGGAGFIPAPPPHSWQI